MFTLNPFKWFERRNKIKVVRTDAAIRTALLLINQNSTSTYMAGIRDGIKWVIDEGHSIPIQFHHIGVMTLRHDGARFLKTRVFIMTVMFFAMFMIALWVWCALFLGCQPNPTPANVAVVSVTNAHGKTVSILVDGLTEYYLIPKGRDTMHLLKGQHLQARQSLTNQILCDTLVIEGLDWIIK